MEQQENQKKLQRIILDLNKNGLSYLTTEQINQAHDYFRKAQRTVLDQLKINPQHSRINQLAGITYNNLACYYKKCNKPKVALTYLKKALEIEVDKVEDWTSTASTHLNICAIYSFLKKHQQAADHAALALTMLGKIDNVPMGDGATDSDKSYWNTKMLAHYNLGIQLEHLKRYEQSRKEYLGSKEIVERQVKINHNLLRSIQQSLKRVDIDQQNSKKRLLDLLAKRKQIEAVGNYEFMRRNKKNYGDNSEWKAMIEARKYNLYRSEVDKRIQGEKKSNFSTEKVRKLAPIQQQHYSYINLSIQTKRSEAKQK